MHMEWVFTIKVTPLGENLYLLEEAEVGDIKAMVEEANGWLEQWFDEIKEWTYKMVDNKIFTWIIWYKVPYHAWSLRFFKFIISLTTKYIYSDDDTRNHIHMDVARILD